MIFANEEHADFYEKKIEQFATEANSEADTLAICDVYHRALIYTLGICEETRRHFDELYIRKKRAICPENIHAAWHTGTSVKVTRLAYQLFTDGVPTATGYDDDGGIKEDFGECQRYSVSDTFCCELAPYFMQAVQIRYPEYFH